MDLRVAGSADPQKDRVKELDTILHGETGTTTRSGLPGSSLRNSPIPLDESKPWLTWQRLRHMEARERLVFVTGIEAARFVAQMVASSTGLVKECERPEEAFGGMLLTAKNRGYLFREIWVTDVTGLHAQASTESRCWYPAMGSRMVPPHQLPLFDPLFSPKHVVEAETNSNWEQLSTSAEKKAAIGRIFVTRSPWYGDLMEESRSLPLPKPSSAIRGSTRTSPISSSARPPARSWKDIADPLAHRVLTKQLRSRAKLFAEGLIVTRSMGGLQKIMNRNRAAWTSRTPDGHHAVEQLLRGERFDIDQFDVTGSAFTGSSIGTGTASATTGGEDSIAAAQAQHSEQPANANPTTTSTSAKQEDTSGSRLISEYTTFSFAGFLRAALLQKTTHLASDAMNFDKHSALRKIRELTSPHKGGSRGKCPAVPGTVGLPSAGAARGTCAARPSASLGLAVLRRRHA
ncbi:unnamed protein product [Amoebophrya sp. A25]|nr:unnamed protein product [Amoebophrya sp. A25]|eukprot:GSA25T00022163001.1